MTLSHLDSLNYIPYYIRFLHNLHMNPKLIKLNVNCGKKLIRNFSHWKVQKQWLTFYYHHWTYFCFVLNFSLRIKNQASSRWTNEKRIALFSKESPQRADPLSSFLVFGSYCFMNVPNVFGDTLQATIAMTLQRIDFMSDVQLSLKCIRRGKPSLSHSIDSCHVFPMLKFLLNDVNDIGYIMPRYLVIGEEVDTNFSQLTKSQASTSQLHHKMKTDMRQNHWLHSCAQDRISSLSMHLVLIVQLKLLVLIKKSTLYMG